MADTHERGTSQFDDRGKIELMYNEQGEALSEICHAISGLYDDELVELVPSIDDEDVEIGEKIKMIFEFMNKFCNKGDGSLIDTFIDDLLEAGDVSGIAIFRGMRLSKNEIFEKIVDLDRDIYLLTGRTEKLIRIPVDEDQEEAVFDEAVVYLREFRIKMEELIDLMKASLDFFKMTVH